MNPKALGSAGVLNTNLKRKRVPSVPTENPTVKRFYNFTKSGLPSRLLFYHDCEWIDFGADLVDLIRGDFHAKRPIVEVAFGGQYFLLDFVRSLYIDTKTGLSKPVAWIDEHGKCFFPESNHENVPVGCAEETCQVISCMESLHSTAESSNSESVRAKQRQAKSRMAMFGETDCKKELCSSKIETKIDDSMPFSDYVKNLFLSGMSPYIDAKDPLNILKVPVIDDFGENRFHTFQKQVDITKALRGNANVRYAWLPATKSAVKEVMLHGLLKREKLASDAMYGIGVHLAPANSPTICAAYSDVDENGLSYMMLCRVIMGHMEIVLPGSKQFRPSSKLIDSGVDEFVAPKHYVICDMNRHTHIFAEYVITFKLSSEARERLFKKEKASNSSGVSNGTSVALHLKEEKGDPLPVISLGESKGRDLGRVLRPTSPSMPFSMLFAAISTKISAKDMDLVNAHYEEFKVHFFNTQHPNRNDNTQLHPATNIKREHAYQDDRNHGLKEDCRYRADSSQARYNYVGY